MKKLIITGATGFIGFNLIEQLSKKYEIFALSRRPISKKTPKNIKFVLYKNINSFLKKNKIHCIVHTAAISPSVGVTIEDYIESNINLTNFLLNRSIYYGVKNFIFLSSLSIYGTIKDNYVDEETNINNPDNYGLTKLICENLIIDKSKKINFSIIRLPGVIGKNSVRNWLTNKLEEIKNNKNIVIFNPSHKFNNLIHVLDLCNFIKKLIKLNKLNNDILCISSTEKIMIKDIIYKLILLNNSSSKVIIKKNSIKSFYIKNSKIKKNYNYKPMKTLDAIEYFSNENNI